MASSKTNSKMQSTDAAARSKPAVTSKIETGTTTARADGQAQAVKHMLTRIETKMTEDQMNATLGDYIRLVQLHKELDDESPKEIRVTWVEPAEMESAKEE